MKGGHIGRDGPTALVTGASGCVAGAMAARFLAGGMRVRALVRTPGQATAATRRGWSPVPGDLRDPDSLREAVAGADIVVHAAAYMGPSRRLAGVVNAQGTRSLAEASLDAGVARFVHISTLSVHGEPMPDGLREDSPLAGPQAGHPYVASKGLAEVAVGEARSHGLPAVILRPGAICAVTNSQWGDLLVDRLREVGWPPTWHPGDVIGWVHTDDLAEMAWLAATCQEAAGETFLAVDENVTMGDYLTPILRALGRPVDPPGRGPVLSRCHLGKIHAMLGYRPRRTFEQTIAQLADLARAGVARDEARVR